MAQTLGVGKIPTVRLDLGTTSAYCLCVLTDRVTEPAVSVPQASLDSFLRFLKTGVAFAFEESPKNLTFLDGLHPYAVKLPVGEW